MNEFPCEICGFSNDWSARHCGLCGVSEPMDTLEERKQMAPDIAHEAKGADHAE